MSASGLQGLLDDLCTRLGRSVAIDDAEFRFVGSSAQVGRLDEPRINTVLERELDDDLRTWLESLDLHLEPGPVSVPPNQAHQSLARFCFPIRVGRRLLGYLWLIDEPETTDEDKQLVLENLGCVLYVSSEAEHDAGDE